MYKRIIYWFKRDLRIDDNRGFYEACINSNEIIPVFIFIPDILDKYKGQKERIGFIVDCLHLLSNRIEEKGGSLYCFYGKPTEIITYLIEKYKPQAIFTNKAFSYTGEETEEDVIVRCREKAVDYLSYNDNFLCDIEKIPYKKVFSHFYKRWRENIICKIHPSPERINSPQIDEPDLKKTLKRIKYEPNSIWSAKAAYSRLKDFDFINYEQTRNRLDTDGTSKLSPYIRFGVISLRQIYKAASTKGDRDSQFIKELAWREFWYHIKLNFKGFKNIEFQEKRRNIKWLNNEEEIQAFIDAKTGYPIIDAAIRQLKAEGWMHNRARMIVASFLTKDLLSDWRIGEKFFREFLLDYDEVVNIGNWQWNASVGPDPRPFRIFNPVIQAEKFDPEGKFIRKYLPELKKYPTRMLHNPLKYKLYYHKPIVNHLERVRYTKSIFFNKTHK